MLYKRIIMYITFRICKLELAYASKDEYSLDVKYPDPAYDELRCKKGLRIKCKNLLFISGRGLFKYIKDDLKWLHFKTKENL